MRKSNTYGVRTRLLGSVAVAVVIALVGAVVAGCGSSDSSGSTEGSGGEKTVSDIAFFGFGAANSYSQATWSGIQEEAKKQGVNARFFDPNFNATKQIAQVQDATASGKYQAFVIQANDSNGIVFAVKQAIAAGITVVAEQNPIGPRFDTLKPQVEGVITSGDTAADSGTGLAEMATMACKTVKEKPCNVAYLIGSLELPSDTARTNALKEELATNPNAKLIATPLGGYTQATGLKATQDLLQAHPEVNVIVGPSQAILGGEKALKQAGATGKVLLVGNGASRQAIDAVKEGRWFATYVKAVKTAGAKAAELAIRAARGEKVPNSYNITQLVNRLGTKENIGDFEGQYDE